MNTVIRYIYFSRVQNNTCLFVMLIAILYIYNQQVNYGND